MADITTIQAANDAAVTDKTDAASISPTDVGARLNAITAELRPYKVYAALLTQNSGSAPVATVLENSIGAIVWSRTGVGDYVATLAGAFTAAKTAVLGRIGDQNNSSSGDNFLSIVWGAQGGLNPTDKIYVQTGNNSDGLSDDMLLDAFIEIRVYP